MCIICDNRFFQSRRAFCIDISYLTQLRKQNKRNRVRDVSIIATFLWPQGHPGPWGLSGFLRLPIDSLFMWSKTEYHGFTRGCFFGDCVRILAKSALNVERKMPFQGRMQPWAAVDGQTWKSPGGSSIRSSHSVFASFVFLICYPARDQHRFFR